MSYVAEREFSSNSIIRRKIYAKYKRAYHYVPFNINETPNDNRKKRNHA